VYEFLTKNGMTVVLHPLHSSNLQSVIFLFPYLKLALNRRFDNIITIQEQSQAALAEFTTSRHMATHGTQGKCSYYRKKKTLEVI
jgi:hypothetical protein